MPYGTSVCLTLFQQTKNSIETNLEAYLKLFCEYAIKSITLLFRIGTYYLTFYFNAFPAKVFRPKAGLYDVSDNPFIILHSYAFYMFSFLYFNQFCFLSVIILNIYTPMELFFQKFFSLKYLFLNYIYIYFLIWLINFEN